MTFRDDGDALLARAAAADAETARLRVENLRLRGDLARAQDASPLPPLPDDGEDQIPPGTIRQSPAATAANALTTRAAEWIAAGVFVLVTFAGLYVGYRIKDSPFTLVGMAIGMVVGWVLAIALMRASQRSQRRWLARVALPMDRAGYLKMLGIGRVRRRVWVSVWVRSMPTDRRGGVTDAVHRILPDTIVGWDGDRLHLASPLLVTWRERRGVAVFHNGPAHAWFRCLVSDALLPALADLQVERVEIE